MFFTLVAFKNQCVEIYALSIFEYFQRIVGRISDSVMRRMIESQHAVQYGYRLLHPTISFVGRVSDSVTRRNSPKMSGYAIANPTYKF